MLAAPKKSHRRNPKQPRQLSSAVTSAQSPRRQYLTYHDRLTILDFCRSNPSMTQTAVAQHFQSQFPSLTQATVSRYLMQEKEIREYVARFPQRLAYKQPLQVVLPAVELALTKWVNKKLEGGRVHLSGAFLCEKARRFSELLGLPDGQVEFSSGWLESFKERMGLRRVWYHGEAASAPVDRIEPEIQRLRPILATYSPRDIFNFDETAVLPCAEPDSGLSNRRMSGHKLDKTRLTFGFCVNADGSEKRPPFILGKSEKPRSFRGRTAKQHGFDYDHNKSAWMTKIMWNKCLSRFNAAMRHQNRHVLLLCDNASAHKNFDPERYPNIRIEFLAAGLTAYIQPLDSGIIRCFKVHFRRAQARRAIERDDLGESKIYHMEQLEAMQMAKAAWDLVSPSTIVNCWRHTGICPPSFYPSGSSDASDSEEVTIISDLQMALDQLSNRHPHVGRTTLSAHAFVDSDKHIETEPDLSEEEIVAEIGQTPNLSLRIN